MPISFSARSTVIMTTRSLVIAWTLCSLAAAYIVDPGPTVIATKGEVWPKPQHESKLDTFYVLRPQTFQFRVVSENCDLLRDAIQRYYGIINATVVSSIQQDDEYVLSKPWKSDTNYAGDLDRLDILMQQPCGDSLPTYEMQEQYNLTVSSNSKSVLSAETIWGILRGLETFSQLLYPTSEEAVSMRLIQDDVLQARIIFSGPKQPSDYYYYKQLQINCTTITDYPRFSHRGLLIDTSRHFIPMPKLLKTLDAMSYNKLNVFHWHITDDQSFPYESIKYPKLSEKGAYIPSQVYSQQDVQKVINYAGARGIRVVVEFDTPGHTRSWGEAIEGLLTPCYQQNQADGKYGPIDPTKNSTYDFLRDFFGEIVEVFPDIYLHLGGDEVEFECWDSNPDIKRFMKENNMSSYVMLEDYYIERLVRIVDALKVRSIVWEEVFMNGVHIPGTTAVHVWRDWGPGWKQVMKSATLKGHHVLLSACWYLDHLSTGGDWKKYYDCEPYDFGGNDDQKKLVLGGEACMWAEVVNEYNIESRVWPRGSAAAEKLWSAEKADNASHVAKRLEEHTCRMNKRGIAAQPPNSSGYCLL